MVDAFAPDELEAPVVDALAVAALVALAATLGGLLELRPTVTAGAAVLVVGGYGLFRLIYAIERVADALDDSPEERPTGTTSHRPADGPSGRRNRDSR